MALEFKYDPWLIIIATLRNYPDRTYRDAGELVEAVLSLEEAHIPTWNAQTVIDWFSSLPPLPPTKPPVTPTPEPPATPTPSETSAPPPSPPETSTYATEISTSTTTSLGAAATPPTSTRHQELVKEAFDLSLPLRCKACNKAKANALIIDCGHIFLCTDCVPTQETCPVCLTGITEFIKVYRS